MWRDLKQTEEKKRGEKAAALQGYEANHKKK